METISRGPQPVQDRTTTKARNALNDPSVSPDKLNALADKLTREANFVKAFMNLGISSAAGGVGGTAVAKSIGAKLSEFAAKFVADEVGLVGGLITGTVGLVVDPASVLGFGSEEEALAAALRDEAVKVEVGSECNL